MNCAAWCLLAAPALVGVAACGQSADSEIPEQRMTLIEGATFRMGTDIDEMEKIASATGMSGIRLFEGELSAHDVTVNDFHIDRYDVTNRRYAEFVAENSDWSRNSVPADQQNGRYLEHWTEQLPPGDTLDHPVTFITWHSAVAYCSWRDKRLPTEAEYEWAAQSGFALSEFPWGDIPPEDSLVSWSGNGIDTTVPVGSYPPNPRGLYDMSGNVWHFTADPWLGSYDDAQSDPDAATIAAGDPDIRRVVRGGSFGANAANLRIRYRDSHRPYDAREMVGFRCARSAE